MNEMVKEQILLIRDTGRTNMFDVAMVLELADELDLDELAEWLPGHRKEYVSFVLYGD